MKLDGVEILFVAPDEGRIERFIKVLSNVGARVRSVSAPVDDSNAPDGTLRIVDESYWDGLPVKDRACAMLICREMDERLALRLLDESISALTWRCSDGEIVYRVSEFWRDLCHGDQQIHKWATFGRLAAGVAHEINTPVQFVENNLRFLGDNFTDFLEVVKQQERLLQGLDVPPDMKVAFDMMEAMRDNVDFEFLLEEVPKAIKQSQKGLQGIAQLTDSIQSLSHPGTGKNGAVDLNDCIQSALTLTKHAWNNAARLELDLDAGLGSLDACESEIQQLIVNLLINAVHAINQSERHQRGELGLIVLRTWKEGDALNFSIADNGIGIEPRMKDCLFDPFTTTKPVRQGTGQGLYIASRIVRERHGGEIECESKPGTGTTFRVSLPVACGVLQEAHPA